MILVYPMLTSASVDPTILPGLIKAVEKYIIIHNTDDVLKHVNSALSDVARVGASGAITIGASIMVAAATAWAAGKVKSRVKVKGKKLELTEQKKVNIIIRGGQKAAQLAQSGASQFGVDADSIKQAGGEAGKQIEKLGKDKGIRGGITGFEMPRYDSVSLEPTWVQVNTNLGAKLLGVKVVPFKVNSTKGMVGLLMQDKELKKMNYLANKMSRIAMRVIFRVARGLKIPGIKDKPITGNPKSDIVWATSQFGKNTFVCFSQLDLEQDDMFTSPKAVQKLHKLGWASLIVTDDVNKQATFCMQQFGGICSTIPYSFIFSSLGKEHSQVYKDLEDAARSAGPFFRKKSTNRRKLFSDARTIAKLNKYSTLRE